MWYLHEDVLNEEEISSITDKLTKLTNVDATIKQEHIHTIKDKYMDVCPRCGSKLVLRTAKIGSHAGKQFYGCSAYPKCKYIKNL